MFGFLFKIMVCILVVFCIHTIWQKVQENYIRPKLKNTNAEIEKYKAIVQEISQQNKNQSREVPAEPIREISTDLESDLNSFLDSILMENHIEIMPVIE